MLVVLHSLSKIVLRLATQVLSAPYLSKQFSRLNHAKVPVLESILERKESLLVNLHSHAKLVMLSQAVAKLSLRPVCLRVVAAAVQPLFQLCNDLLRLSLSLLLQVNVDQTHLCPIKQHLNPL